MFHDIIFIFIIINFYFFIFWTNKGNGLKLDENRLDEYRSWTKMNWTNPGLDENRLDENELDEKWVYRYISTVWRMLPDSPWIY